MAAEGMPFPGRWNGSTISTDLDVIWGILVDTPFRFGHNSEFRKSQLVQANLEKEIEDMNLLLQIEGIHKWYGKVHALKGLNLDVQAGEVVALIGDNGAGKSTLVKIISGVVPPSEGKIFFKGEEVNIDSVSTARKLGIETVHQDRTIIGDLDVTKNIFLTREETKSFGPFKILDHRKMREVAKKLTEKLGLKISSPDQEARFCSGGERQGIAIARAMHFKSRLVILDEPTTALSVKGVEKVLNFVNHLKEENIGVIYITHSLRSGYQIADRFVVMSQGEVVVNIPKKSITFEDLERLCLTG